MKKLVFWRAVLVASLVSAPLAVPAVADPAVATTYVNVRSGPASSSDVLDVLEEGERVERGECRPNGWCYVTRPGPDGWVFSNFLRDAPPEPGAAPATLTVASPSDAVAPSGNEVCFYSDQNYAGEAFCSGTTVLYELPSEANDSITSIRVSGMALARICTEPDLTGACLVVSGDEPELAPLLNDQISSIRIYIGTPPPDPTAP